MQGGDELGFRIAGGLAVAIALLVAGGAMHATAVPDAEPGQQPPGVEPVGGDAAAELDLCLVGLDVSASVGATVDVGVESTVDVRVGLGCEPGERDPPPGGGPTPTETPAPTETPTPTATQTPTTSPTPSATATATPGPTPTPTSTPPDDGDGDGDTDTGSGDGDGGEADDDDDSDPPPVEVDDWWVTPNEVAADEPVTVGLTLRNDYWARQTTAVEVLVDGETVASEYVRVPGEGTTNATFDRRFGTPGSYRVGIRGQGTERVRVVGSPAPTRSTPATAEPTATGTDTPPREVGGFAGRPLIVVAFLVSTLLALGGIRLWRRARPP